MKLQYSISLWNFFHYTWAPSLERALEMIRKMNLGVELWKSWRDEGNFYDPIGRKRVKSALNGMPVSLHTGGARTLEQHKEQIDAAAFLGAEILVIHPDDLYNAGKRPDLKLARKVVDYAKRKKVKLALENGNFDFLSETLEHTKGLGFCLDVGHVYFESRKDPLAAFLRAFKDRLVHLHLQDIRPPDEAEVPMADADHFMLGTGGIPTEDWKLLVQTLREINFNGSAVFEIHPRNPFQTAFHAMRFMERVQLHDVR